MDHIQQLLDQIERDTKYLRTLRAAGRSESDRLVESTARSIEARVKWLALLGADVPPRPCGESDPGSS